MTACGVASKRGYAKDIGLISIAIGDLDRRPWVDALSLLC
jgi:hypothetical protein